VTDSVRTGKRSSLGELHDRALAESPDRGAEGAERFLAWFDRHVDAVPVDATAGDPSVVRGAVHARPPFEEPVPWWRSAPARTVAVGACLAAAMFVAGQVLSEKTHRHPPNADGQRPGPWRTPTPIESTGDLDGADPCRQAVRAEGRSPLVDDFEDNNELVALLEARNGYWVVITDTDPESSEPVLLPLLRPEGSPTNRYALHVSGPTRTKWGASVQLELGPTCYDASAYRGIAFSVRGPGHLFAGVREVDAVPVERGGTCTTACYSSHLRHLEAFDRWTRVEIEWSELHQEGKAEPANPRRLSGLEFLVRPEDTPYDLWIDDVAFVR
jgi:hypothetical protein